MLNAAFRWYQWNCRGKKKKKKIKINIAAYSLQLTHHFQPRLFFPRGCLGDGYLMLRIQCIDGGTIYKRFNTKEDVLLKAVRTDCHHLKHLLAWFMKPFKWVTVLALQLVSVNPWLTKSIAALFMICENILKVVLKFKLFSFVWFLGLDSIFHMKCPPASYMKKLFLYSTFWTLHFRKQITLKFPSKCASSYQNVIRAIF